MTSLETPRSEPRDPDARTGAILSASGLHKHYVMGGQALHVLQGVNLSLKAGEWVAVLGASGSGKSTLLHLLGGLDRPQRGEVKFKGRNVFRLGGMALDRYRNQNVGFVFQFYHLLPEFNALENVLIGAMINRTVFTWPGARARAKKRAAELLDRMGLSQRLKHRPNKLSGGERQRVAIARALINEPDVLLADEPSGNLDRETGKQILDVLGEFHRAGQTIAMVTHDQSIAQAADRRLHLEGGRLV